MILCIGTTTNDLVEIGLKKDKNGFIYKKKFISKRTQAEKLLPGIVKMFKSSRLKLSDLKSIEVASQGGSFTSLRIGVITANALGYALSIPVNEEKSKSKSKTKRAKSEKFRFSLVEPEYSSEPEISIKSKKI